jgi:hypothetical protein
MNKILLTLSMIALAVTFSSAGLNYRQPGTSGTSLHSGLLDLDYASSGHTGFQQALSTPTWVAGDSAKLGGLGAEEYAKRNSTNTFTFCADYSSTTLAGQPSGDAHVEWNTPGTDNYAQLIDGSDDTYISVAYGSTAQNYLDMYTLTGATIPAGVSVSSVTAIARVTYWSPIGDDGVYVRLTALVNGTTYYGTLTTIYKADGWQNLTHTWDYNPDTGRAWSAADLQNIRLGVLTNNKYTWYVPRCSELRLSVGYNEFTPGVSVEGILLANQGMLFADGSRLLSGVITPDTSKPYNWTGQHTFNATTLFNDTIYVSSISAISGTTVYLHKDIQYIDFQDAGIRRITTLIANHGVDEDLDPAGNRVGANFIAVRGWFDMFYHPIRRVSDMDTYGPPIYVPHGFCLQGSSMTDVNVVQANYGHFGPSTPTLSGYALSNTGDTLLEGVLYIRNPNGLIIGTTPFFWITKNLVNDTDVDICGVDGGTVTLKNLSGTADINLYTLGNIRAGYLFGDLSGATGAVDSLCRASTGQIDAWLAQERLNNILAHQDIAYSTITLTSNHLSWVQAVAGSTEALKNRIYDTEQSTGGIVANAAAIAELQASSSTHGAAIAAQEAATYNLQHSSFSLFNCYAVFGATTTAGTHAVPFAGPWPTPVTVSTMTVQVDGGTSLVCMIEMRPSSAITADGTDMWSGNVTAMTGTWTGGQASDFTVPVGYSLWLVPVTWSGAIDALLVDGWATHD